MILSYCQACFVILVQFTSVHIYLLAYLLHLDFTANHLRL